MCTKYKSMWQMFYTLLLLQKDDTGKTHSGLRIKTPEK